jgi:hypothetical protein
MQPLRWCQVHHPRCASTSLGARLENSSLTCFQVKQPTKSRRVSHVVLILSSILWRNKQTVTRLVLRSKPRNHRGDFYSQITKPYLPILRPKPKNLKPPVLKPNQEKPSTLVLRANQKNMHSSSTCARFRPHTVSPDLPIVQSPSTRHALYHSWSSGPGLPLLTRLSSLPVMSHLSLAHHKTSKCDSPHNIDRGRTTETSRIQIQTMASQLLFIIKPRYWLLGFSISPLMSTLIIKSTKFEF